MTVPVPPVTGGDWRAWARQLRTFLQRNLTLLLRKDADSRATEDGVLLWDSSGQYPVVSKDGEWRQLILADGYAFLTQDADVTAAAADTAYAVTYDTPTMADGVSLDGTNPERIVFEEGGTYLLAFSAQIASTSSSTVEFRFWPQINGSAAPGSTIVANLHQNDASLVVSRSAVFQVSAGDYLEVMWAISSTSGLLRAEAATTVGVEGFDSPAAPATSLSITRLRA